jgi:hypothetical protein
LREVHLLDQQLKAAVKIEVEEIHAEGTEEEIPGVEKQMLIAPSPVNSKLILQIHKNKFFAK